MSIQTIKQPSSFSELYNKKRRVCSRCQYHSKQPHSMETAHHLRKKSFELFKFNFSAPICIDIVDEAFNVNG